MLVECGVRLHVNNAVRSRRKGMGETECWKEIVVVAFFYVGQHIFFRLLSLTMAQEPELGALKDCLAVRNKGGD